MRVTDWLPLAPVSARRHRTADEVQWPSECRIGVTAQTEATEYIVGEKERIVTGRG